MSAKLHFDFFIHIYMYTLLFCLSVCLFVSNKRQNDFTDSAQIFCGTSRDPWKGLWMIEFSKICLLQKIFFENFENPQIFGVVFVLQFTQGDWEHVHDWKRRGRKAPLKPGTYTNKKQTLLQVAYHPLSKKGLCTVHNYYVSCLLDF